MSLLAWSRLSANCLDDNTFGPWVLLLYVWVILTLLTHIYCQWTASSLVYVMACRLFGTKPLPQQTITYCHLDPGEQIQWKFNKITMFFVKKMHLKCRLRNGSHFVSTSMYWLIEAEWRIYIRRQPRSLLVQMMACRLVGAKPLSEPTL